MATHPAAAALRPVAALPVSRRLREQLVACGFRTVQDLMGMTIQPLAKELDVSAEEALEVLESAGLGGGGGGDGAAVVASISGKRKADGAAGVGEPATQRSALEILRQEQDELAISTGSAGLDGVLDGGVALRCITEFCGAPGIGKTQVGMQLALNVQIPSELGGLAGHAIFVDTEGSFMPERAEEMAAALRADLLARPGLSQAQRDALDTITVNDLLAHIHYYRIQDYTELLALTHVLPSFLESHPLVRLVVVDSIAFHFRHSVDDHAMRSRILGYIAQTFLTLADRHKLAVVLINQVTTRVSADAQSYLEPALGASWGHSSTHRIVLHWQNEVRKGFVFKSSTLSQRETTYSVTAKGVR